MVWACRCPGHERARNYSGPAEVRGEAGVSVLYQHGRYKATGLLLFEPSDLHSLMTPTQLRDTPFVPSICIKALYSDWFAQATEGHPDPFLPPDTVTDTEASASAGAQAVAVGWGRHIPPDAETLPECAVCSDLADLLCIHELGTEAADSIWERGRWRSDQDALARLHNAYRWNALSRRYNPVYRVWPARQRDLVRAATTRTPLKLLQADGRPDRTVSVEQPAAGIFVVRGLLAEDECQYIEKEAASIFNASEVGGAHQGKVRTDDRRYDGIYWHIMSVPTVWNRLTITFACLKPRG